MTQYQYKISTAIGDAQPDIFSESSTQLFPLGTKIGYGDRTFRYAKLGGTAVTAGKTLQSPAAVADHRDIAVQAVAAAGATTVTVTLGSTAATADQYNEGYLHINDDAGQGQLLRIKDHAAADASANLELTLYDKVTTALSTDSKADLILSNYSGLIVAPNTETGSIVGVTVIDMTADYYGWIQVSGPCSVLTEGTIVLGNNVVRSGGSNAGSVAPATDDLLAIIGQVLVVNGNTDNSVINLNIE